MTTALLSVTLAVPLASGPFGFLPLLLILVLAAAALVVAVFVVRFTRKGEKRNG